MRLFTLSSKLFIKDKVLTIVSSVSILALVIYQCMTFTSLQQNWFDSGVQQLWETLEISILCLIFFTFISYEYFHKAKSANIDECLDSINNGKFKLLFSQFSFMLLLATAVTLIVCGFNLGAYFYLNIAHIDFLQHILLNIVINIFLVSLLGIVFGLFIALYFKRLSAYLLATLFILLSSQIFESFVFTVFNTKEVNIYPIFEFFNFYSPSLRRMPNYLFGFSILPYRTAILWLWISVLLLAILIKLAKRKPLFLKIVSAVCAAACVLSAYTYFKPSSKNIMSHNPQEALLYDVYYYSNEEQKEQKPDFQVTDYNLDISITDVLNVNASLSVSRSLSEYKFTLYHGFNITSVKDQDNHSLVFEQSGDYVVVKGNPNISLLKLEYTGYSPLFYSNSQGVCLPGFFPYYPHAGYQRVYLEDKQSFNPILLDGPIDFQVTVDAPYDLYTNLNAQDKASFSGKTNGATLLSGFAETVTQNDISVVYPYLISHEYSSDIVDRETTSLQEAAGKNPRYAGVKKILVLPNLNLLDAEVVLFSDHITTNFLIDIVARVETSLIDPRKRDLYNTVTCYFSDRNRFNETAELQKQDADAVSEEYRYEQYLSEKITLLGEAKVIEAINEYIDDREDTRSIYDFLMQLK